MYIAREDFLACLTMRVRKITLKPELKLSLKWQRKSGIAERKQKERYVGPGLKERSGLLDVRQR